MKHVVIVMAFAFTTTFVDTVLLGIEPELDLIWISHIIMHMVAGAIIALNCFKDDDQKEG